MITSTATSAPAFAPAGGSAQAAPGDRDWLLTAGGAGLVLLALSKRSTIGLAALLGGGYLLYRTLPAGSLKGLLPESLGSLGASLGALGCGSTAAGRTDGDWYPSESADLVEEASMDSFPASDPPANY